MKVKRCPVCGGVPQYVYYSIPNATKDPDSIYVLLKRLECSECGATVAMLVMTCDDAESYWNDINPNTGKRYVLEKVGSEPCSEVEERRKSDETD